MQSQIYIDLSVFYDFIDYIKKKNTSLKLNCSPNSQRYVNIIIILQNIEYIKCKHDVLTFRLFSMSKKDIFRSKHIKFYKIFIVSVEKINLQIFFVNTLKISEKYNSSI